MLLKFALLEGRYFSQIQSNEKNIPETKESLAHDVCCALHNILVINILFLKSKPEEIKMFLIYSLIQFFYFTIKAQLIEKVNGLKLERLELKSSKPKDCARNQKIVQTGNIFHDRKSIKNISTCINSFLYVYFIFYSILKAAIILNDSLYVVWSGSIWSSRCL